jgi:hypothetical protein
MIEYTWNIAQMDAYPEYAGNTEVVFNVHWTLSGAEGTYLGSTYGSQILTLDPEAVFIPYQDLTLEQVVGWVKAAMGPNQVEFLEQKINDQIQKQINPPILYPPLPWVES